MEKLAETIAKIFFPFCLMFYAIKEIIKKIKKGHKASI